MSLAEACGDEPGAICERVYDSTGSATAASVADWLVDRPLQIAVIWLVAWIAARVLRRIIARFTTHLSGAMGSGTVRKVRERAPTVLVGSATPNLRAAARAETISGVLRSVSTGIVYTFAAIYTLEVVGLNLGPLIAGAGIAGVALGFGAQSLVRDVLAGLFIIIEDQYGMGDVVDLGEAVGTVEAVNLRTTRLRDVNGTVWHVPNGEIVRVGNKSQQWARAVLDVVVGHGTDVDAALAIMKRVADDVLTREALAEEVLDEAEVWGVEALTPQGITLRMVATTRPGAQWKVLRALRQEISTAMAAAGIEMSRLLPPVPPTP